MISRERVLIFLREKQEFDGGYSGNDLTKLAELLMVTPFGLRRRLSFWIKTDKEFSQFIYLGKEKPPITLFEFFKIDHELRENPIKVKKGIYGNIQEERKSRNQKPLSESTFYRNIKQEILSIYCSETNNWFRSIGHRLRPKFIPKSLSIDMRIKCLALINIHYCFKSSFYSIVSKNKSKLIACIFSKNRTPSQLSISNHLLFRTMPSNNIIYPPTY